MPSFDDLDHVKLFVAKETNLTHVYAWTGAGQTDAEKILGNWPGTTLSNYDDNWLTYDFNVQYTNFSIVINAGGDQSKSADLSINGIGSYWYYDGQLVKDSVMPDINPPEPEPEPEPEPSSSSQQPPATESEGNIFHAFDWSLDVIKNNLQQIKDAGYTAIQTSPLQRPKDYSDQYKSTNDWWKLYQPVSFDVPTGGTWIGTPTQLKSLTDAAHSKGLKIIVDVVANHMGANGNNPNEPHSSISQYESEIMSKRSETFRSVDQCDDWQDRYKVTHWRMGGYPELNTGHSVVQDEVYKYLKQLIDNGVDGFRFDAAKHIETPFDSDNIKSDFWTNTAVKAEKYAASSKNKDIFMYGEILNETPQIPFNYYTTHDNQKLLDAVTDNKTGNSILAAIKNGNSSGAAKSGYDSGLPASETVLWAESHDTYMNDDERDPSCTRRVDQDKVDKAYALVGARKGTKALYFARPNFSSSIGSGSTQNNNYKSALIKAVNTLKKDMGNNNESIRSDNDLAYVERYGNNKYGASIVKMNGSGSVTLSFSNLPDGTYKDLASGTTYSMSGGRITLNIGNTGAIVIEKV